MKAIIIAAPLSGCGKTTITLGILECLRRRGLKVAPFKVGPDFIDPGYHRLVCARPSVNLDGWMCPPDFVRETFAVQAADADIAVIEGVMGLYDGIGGLSEEGSTAQVAKILGAPVLLVVDARSMARSAAAVVKGFADFDAGVRVVGVIFNNVGSEAHARILREAVECAVPGVRMAGCLPRDEGLHIPSRHLGLLTAEENPLSAEFLDHLVETVKAHVDFGVLWGCAEVHPGEQPPMQEESPPLPGKSVPIAVARDEAFSFVYEDNLRLLREAGAELVEFSPLRDAALPESCSGVYLPGGYPEEFADALAANTAMTEAIRGAIEGGMPVYAECGGFIYLTEGIKGHEAFVGVFPVTTRMLPRRKALGYREVELTADSLIGPKGTVARGHEFHYSEMDEMPSHVERIYRVRKHSADLGLEGYRYRNCLASYIHLHFGSNPALPRTFVESCRKFTEM